MRRAVQGCLDRAAASADVKITGSQFEAGAGADRDRPGEGDGMEKVDIAKALADIREHWRPRVVGALNGQEVKLAKFVGTFPWHHHDDADELFLGVEGTFRVEFRDRVVTLGPGEFLIVPRGVEHRTAADAEASVLLFEPAGVRNTGNIVDANFTASSPPMSETA